MMTGIESILLGFFQGDNKITPDSKYHDKVEQAKSVLLKPGKIKYLIGYPQGGEPAFYVVCETEALMEHAKDWLNCSLPRFCCKYARPCKEPEYPFEAVLFEKWPHGYLKVSIWSQQHTQFDKEKYWKFIPYAFEQMQSALEEMITRFESSPVIKQDSEKSVGMLIKGFIQAYKDSDLDLMDSHYSEIMSREGLERRNKDTLKFMFLEKERKWPTIIRFAHERNVMSQVISSGVVTAIMNALVYQSCEGDDALKSFEIDWPALYVNAQEFCPLLAMTPSFETESDWYLWAVLAYTLNIEGFAEKAGSHVDKAWLNRLLEQDNSINAQKVKLVDVLDVANLDHDEQNVTEVLNYAQTCHESELMSLYEWLEATPIHIKLSVKGQAPLRRLWQQVELNVADYVQTASV
ncbi:hypothetical protein NDJ08_15720 [Vibrio alginolyticus]|uniref:hypothetical protein n=1 Tax=Vibrio alginolyticus TaxID=663 RepID=UPI00215C3AD3|nr:hypothetical protein [Vibrio alginolyticus]MCR9520666.1 hypothetical protein [Vibrio alginolyticus]MCS0168042.1 hypothetical protein [Vibrio alginolyticus]